MERVKNVKIPELPPDGLDLRDLLKKDREAIMDAYSELRRTPRGYRIGQRVKVLHMTRTEADKGDESAKRELKKDPLWIVGHKNGEWW